MPLVTASRISMHFGGPHLLEDVSLKVEPGARIGLIGRNGSGKSTLLKLLGGRLDPTDGQVTIARDVTIATQDQELVFEPGATVFATMRGVFRDEARREARLRELEAELARGDAPDRVLREYTRLQEEQAQRNVYDVDRRIESILTSLGLDESTWEKAIATFSGGERNIIGLARVLLMDPDLMLLDEPSNHLDMEGVEWFIEFLRRSRAAFVMVSHNRHLLDATTDEIWDLERRRIVSWTGNYSDFQRQKAEAIARQERQFKVQQRLIERIEFQARRLMDMANAYDDPGQAKRAKAMLKRIDRMDKVEKPLAERSSFKATLKGAQRHGRIALSVNDFSHAFGERVLFENANLEIEYGDRVCLVGPNGSGKTTLFRAILERGSWENPELRLGKSVKVGEYRQLHDVLDPDVSLIDWVVSETHLLQKDAADLLHRFLFTREDLDRTIRTLSGGEKSRLQLARLVHEKVNFLFLDEPTNHIDIPSCEVLEEMLQEFDGTLFVISHDRYFLDKLVDRVVEVEDHQLVYHRATFAEWWQERFASRDRVRRTALLDRSESTANKEEARQAYEERMRAKRERERSEGHLLKVERAIEEGEARQQELEGLLERAWAPGGDPSKAEAWSRELARLQESLESLYAEWEGLA